MGYWDSIGMLEPQKKSNIVVEVLDNLMKRIENIEKNLVIKG